MAADQAQEMWAVFQDVPAARKEVGRHPEAEVFSAEPPETLLGVHRPAGARLGLYILAGGLLGGGTGGALAAMTGIWMGLDVGGMPRVPFAPLGIVVFAIGTLGVISAALIVLLVEGRLLRHRLEMPEAARRQVAGGAVALRLFVSEAQRDALAAELSAAGAEITTKAQRHQEDQSAMR